MQVRIRNIMAGVFGNFQPGEVADLPDDVAKHLLESNQASPVEDPTPEKTPEEQEVESAERVAPAHLRVERAVNTRQGKRGK